MRLSFPAGLFQPVAGKLLQFLRHVIECGGFVNVTHLIRLMTTEGKADTALNPVSCPLSRLKVCLQAWFGLISGSSIFTRIAHTIPLASWRAINIWFPNRFGRVCFAGPLARRIVEKRPLPALPYKVEEPHFK